MRCFQPRAVWQQPWRSMGCRGYATGACNTGRPWRAGTSEAMLATNISASSSCPNARAVSKARCSAVALPTRAASRCVTTLRSTLADSKAQFENQLMPEDILHLRATSMTIMQDPICELPSEEVAACLVDRRDPIKDLPRWHPRRVGTMVTQPFRERKLAVSNFTDLILERLDNERLNETFDIDTGFNMQVYFMILHVWLLHQRLVLEGSVAKRLDEDLFESCWTIVRNWMWLKKVPEYRFDAELQNAQEYMFGCCVALDKALERSDILPARLQQVLWANVYSGSVKKDATALTRLTKYVLRQLGLVLQLDKEHFLAGNFKWADYPLKAAPVTSKRQQPSWREQFSEEMAAA